MNEQYIEEKFKTIDEKLDKMNHYVHKNEDRINDFEKSFAVSMESINNSLATLSDLPNVMTGIKETMVLMQVELKRNTEEITKINDKVNKNKETIKKIDEEGQFNLRIWFRDNWIKLVIGGGGAIALVEYIISKLPQ